VLGRLVGLRPPTEGDEVPRQLGGGWLHPDSRNRERMSALHFAAERGEAGVVEALLVRFF
jgi:hypothetical protein